MSSTKYDRTLVALGGEVVEVDVYRVLDAFNVNNPQLSHLIKKALCTGVRGHKDFGEDLQDIVDSANSALLMQQQKEAIDVIK